MKGEYREKLVTGGELVINSNSWYIQYYFPGPDLRYNGTFIVVDGFQIDKYINAWKDNFDTYQRLKETISSEGEFSTEGKMGMNIRVGTWRFGVCLKSYHLPINDKNSLNKIIDDYTYSKHKAEVLMPIVGNMVTLTDNSIDAKLKRLDKSNRSYNLQYELLLDLYDSPNLFEVLKKYNITLDEFMNIIKLLKKKGAISNTTIMIDWILSKEEIKKLLSEKDESVSDIISFKKQSDQDMFIKPVGIVMKGKSYKEYADDKLDISSN